MADYYFFHTVEGPFKEDTGVEGYYAVGGWLVSPEQYTAYKEKGLSGVEGALYPAYMTTEDSNEYIVPEPPPLGLKDLSTRVEVGGYYGSDLAFSFIEGNPVYYYYPEAEAMFPSVLTSLPTVPQVSFTAGYENKHGYTGNSKWEDRRISMRGGTGYDTPDYSGYLLAPGYSYPEGFFGGNE